MTAALPARLVSAGFASAFGSPSSLSTSTIFFLTLLLLATPAASSVFAVPAEFDWSVLASGGPMADLASGEVMAESADPAPGLASGLP